MSKTVKRKHKRGSQQAKQSVGIRTVSASTARRLNRNICSNALNIPKKARERSEIRRIRIK